MITIKIKNVPHMVGNYVVRSWAPYILYAESEVPPPLTLGLTEPCSFDVEMAPTGRYAVVGLQVGVYKELPGVTAGYNMITYQTYMIPGAGPALSHKTYTYDWVNRTLTEEGGGIAGIPWKIILPIGALLGLILLRRKKG